MISFVNQFAEVSANVSAHTFSPDASISVGNLAVLVISTGAGRTVSSVTGTQSNNWTVDVNSTGNRSCMIVSCVVENEITTSDTITVNFSAASLCTVVGLEFSGLATTTPWDKQSSNFSNTGTTSLASGSTATLSQANELVIAGLASNSAPPDLVYPSGYTPISTSSGLALVAYKIVSSTDAVSASWSWSANRTVGTVVSTYKAATEVTSNWKIKTESGWKEVMPVVF